MKRFVIGRRVKRVAAISQQSRKVALLVLSWNFCHDALMRDGRHLPASRWNVLVRELDSMAREVKKEQKLLRQLREMGEDDVVFEVDDALRRIDEGRYGVCEGCHQSVEKPRLKALPFVRLCIGCQSEREKGKVRHRPSAAL